MSIKARYFVIVLVLSLNILSWADFRTVGVYDPDDGPHHNQVDQSGVYDSHTGSAGPGNVIDLATFQALIGGAFEADAGGVVDGEGPDDSMGSDDIVTAFFGINGAKSASFEHTSGNFSFGSGGGSGNRLPLSGDHRFAKGDTNDFILTVGEVSGGEPGEVITLFAGSLIERDNRETTPEVTATFSDGSTVTATADMAGDDNSPNSKDTFFGFVAPAGASIVEVDFQLNQYVHMDEMAFVTSIFDLNPEQASSPSPVSGGVDVPQSTSLSWTPAADATQHDVYLATDSNAVHQADRAKPMGALVSEAQNANAFSPKSALALGQTYYWRIDEVQGATIHNGDVWAFTVEPMAYPMGEERMTVTASSAMDLSGTGPEETVNASGLTGAGDLHGTDRATMWLSAPDGQQPTWIQYSFDKLYRLQALHVWNYNEGGLNTMFGLREVTIEYSEDGSAWIPLDGVREFAQAPGLANYASNTVVDLSDVVAQHVRLTAVSNWSPGNVFNQYGLSEVRFEYIPMSARDMRPAQGSTDVESNVTLNWRA
ncbi:MAG: discoidin domain-containing protein, partial [Phycisphaeraceae bacterium]|nr:discoidin domain-containing protein [Phycisphaeraceae bacterium]